MIGTGILKGMAVTLRNFAGSYFEKDRLITVQYPEERNPLPENYRNFPILIYDTDDARAGDAREPRDLETGVGANSPGTDRESQGEDPRVPATCR